MTDTSVLTIDLAAYQRNLRALRRKAGRARLCAVVKANAYGHGLVPCAWAAIQAGVEYLGIVDNDEIKTLRESGISTPLLRLRPALIDEVREAAGLQVEELVGDLDAAERIAAWGRRRKQPISVHLKLDVGMGRAGLNVETCPGQAEKILKLKGLNVVGLMTHLPCADEANQSLTARQLQRFRFLADVMHAQVSHKMICHAANSATLLRFPEGCMDMVRPGIATYGLDPGPDCPLSDEFQPVMSWKTYVVQIRHLHAGATIGYGMTYTVPEAKRIGTLPVGYANGFDRRLSNCAEVLVCGKRCPVLGRVSMDLVSIDLTSVPEAQVGEEAVLLGCQGNECITATDWARWMNTITYEIVTNLGRSTQQNRTVYLETT